MKKIGIISFYYKNYNYGGALQAYALTTYLNSCFSKTACSAEQICYDPHIVKLSIIERVKRFISRGHIIDKFKVKVKDSEFSKDKHAGFKDNFQKFLDCFIPHSGIVYNDKNYLSINEKYDLFVVGSDQVWNPLAVRDIYLLKGINKTKISYAASVASGGLKLLERVKYRALLEQFDYLSVREKSSVDLLNNLLNKNVNLSVDPVFLLNRTHWISLLNSFNKDNGAYAFAYFLSPPSQKMRKLISDYSSKNNCKIIGISGTYNATYFEQIEKCTPLEFLYLLSKSNFVFTDSFHAIAFSVIFRVPFFVSVRQCSKVDMSERIIDFLRIICMSDKLIDNNFSVNSVCYEGYNFDLADANLSKLIESSNEYLINAILKSIF